MSSPRSPNERRRYAGTQSRHRFAACFALFGSLSAAIASCGRTATRGTADDSGSDLGSNSGDGFGGTRTAIGGEPIVDAGADVTQPSDADMDDASIPDESGEHGPYSELTLSSDSVACGLKEDGGVECWGGLPDGGVQRIEGPFTRISSVDNTACGIDPEGAVHCWFTAGSFQVEDLLPKLPGVFSEISIGGRVPCGIQLDKSILCNGNLYSGNPVEGSFVRVAGAPAMTCGLGETGELNCWTWLRGATAPEPAIAPTGAFLQVATGMTHACAIATDGSIQCWGDDTTGATAAPEGEFLQVAAGDRHSCAIRVDGSLVCWGLDDDGESSPPGGSFREVHAGVRSSCALTVGGFAVCWGHPI